MRPRKVRKKGNNFFPKLTQIGSEFSKVSNKLFLKIKSEFEFRMELLWAKKWLIFGKKRSRSFCPVLDLSENFKEFLFH